MVLGLPRLLCLALAAAGFITTADASSRGFLLHDTGDSNDAVGAGAHGHHVKRGVYDNDVEEDDDEDEAEDANAETEVDHADDQDVSEANAGKTVEHADEEHVSEANAAKTEVDVSESDIERAERDAMMRSDNDALSQDGVQTVNHAPDHYSVSESDIARAEADATGRASEDATSHSEQKDTSSSVEAGDEQEEKELHLMEGEEKEEEEERSHLFDEWKNVEDAEKKRRSHSSHQKSTQGSESKEEEQKIKDLEAKLAEFQGREERIFHTMHRYQKIARALNSKLEEEEAESRSKSEEVARLKKKLAAALHEAESAEVKVADEDTELSMAATRSSVQKSGVKHTRFPTEGFEDTAIQSWGAKDEDTRVLFHTIVEEQESEEENDMSPSKDASTQRATLVKAPAAVAKVTVLDGVPQYIPTSHVQASSEAAPWSQDIEGVTVSEEEELQAEKDAQRPDFGPLSELVPLDVRSRLLLLRKGA